MCITGAGNSDWPITSSPPFPFGTGEETENEEGFQLIVNPCCDALSSHFSCYLNINLSVLVFLVSSFETTKPQFDMQVLPLSLCQTISDCGGESASLSARCNFLGTYIIHVCVVAAYV